MKPTSQLERLASPVVVFYADLCDALTGLEIAQGIRALAGRNPLARETSGEDDQPKPTAPRL